MRRIGFVLLLLIGISLTWSFSHKAPDFRHLPIEELKIMEKAGNQIQTLYVEFSPKSIFLPILCNWNHLEKEKHYPPKDVFDPSSHSQYYYHSHRKGEHGHFHIFLREKGFPKTVEVRNPDGFVQLIAISLDRHGYPSKLFLTNNWVTGETERSVEELKELLPCFQLEKSRLTDQWIESMIVLFHPQIESLWKKREQFFLRSKRPKQEILKDRKIEILAEEKIDLSRQLKAVREVIDQKK